MNGRRLFIISLIILSVAAAIGLVVISPLALGGLSGLAQNWDRLSLIGQTYGAASALLSVIALVGVAASLIFQSRELKSAREQTLRMSHSEFMRLAMEDPLYAEIWAPLNPPGNFSVQRQHMYVNLVISHWEMEYVLGNMTDEHLRAIAHGVFSTAAGRRYWQYARPTRMASAVGHRERRFNRFLDNEYTRASAGSAAGLPRQGPAVPAADPPAPAVTRLAVPVALAVAGGVLIRRIWRGRRRRAGQ